LAQVPIPGGPARRSPESLGRAQEAAQKRQIREARPIPEGPDGENKRPPIVDQTKLSAELTEELGRKDDPQANADQIVQNIQGLDPARLDQQQQGQKTNEIGAARGVDGSARKRTPRIQKGQQPPRVQAQKAPNEADKTPAQPNDKEKDRVDYSAELRERRSAA
jgi:hypothetical protein